ncbi:hypothetical protein [Botrimarina sp.]|uniref:hypothetical protein n=1 Tax=Botrimarina sp. TaxID=2795802 RepID=UPI0032EE3BF6
MKPPLIDAVTATLAELGDELADAQHGPIDPQLRSELARLSAATRVALARVAQSHAAAEDAIAAKRRRVAQLAAANKAAIQAKQSPPAAPEKSVPPPVAPIDPTLGRRTAAALLARQPKPPRRETNEPVGSVLDHWDWSPRPRDQ